MTWRRLLASFDPREWIVRWAFSDRRWRRAARPGCLRRWWLRRSHSWCCNFEQELLAWLASRLGEYADRIADGGGAPWGYPNPEEAEGGPNGVTDFDAWVRDVTDVAKTLRYAAEHYGELSESNQLIAEVDAALAWVARWRRAVWI